MRAENAHLAGVRAALTERLFAAGFTQRRKSTLIFQTPLTADAAAWLGLNARTHKTADGEIGVRARIGIRHEPLMRLYANLLPALDLKASPSIVTGLSDLLGEPAREWEFEAGDDPAYTADNLVQTVVDVGLPWCRDHVEPSAMREAVRARTAFGVTHSTEQILPLLDVLCGECGLAAERLHASIAARGKRSDMESLEFGEFAANLLRHIESRDNSKT